MTKEWIPALIALFILLFFVTLIVVFTNQPPAPAKPSTSDIVACEIDKAAGNHPDPCPAN